MNTAKIHDVKTIEKNVLINPMENDLIPIFNRREKGILIWRIDLGKLVFTGIEHHVETVLGYKREEILGGKLKKVLTASSYKLLEEYIPCWLERLDKNSGNGFFVAGLLECLSKTYRKVWIEITAYLTLNNEKQFEVNCLSRIVKRRGNAAEFFLNDRFEEKYRLKMLWKKAIGILICLDRNGQCILVNDKFLQDINKPRKEVVGSLFLDILPKNWSKLHQEYFSNSLAGNNNTFIERLINDEGEIKWVYGLYLPICLDEQAADKIIILAIDVNKYPYLMEQLVEAENYCNIGSCEYDLANNKILCSEKALELLELSKEELEHESFQALFKRIDKKELLRLKEKLLKSLFKEDFCEDEVSLLLPSQKQRVVKIKLLFIKDERGEVQRIFGSIEDITEQKNILKKTK